MMKSSTMRNVLLAISVLSVTSFSFASSEGLTIGNYLHLKDEVKRGDETSKLVMDASFSGLLEGIIFSSIVTQIANGATGPGDKKVKSYFCIPSDEQINSDDLQKYVDNYIEKHGEDVDENSRLAAVSVKALKETYPCN